MTVLILGPNGSGKSIYAERTAAALSTGTLIYLATMIPFAEEGQARVEKHRKQREGMGFQTVEKPYDVSAAPLSPDAAVLLEDVPNLIGNALFGEHRNGDTESVFVDIKALCASCRSVVLVSIDGLKPTPEHDGRTKLYIKELNLLNDRLVEFADIVIKMDEGHPIFVRGEENALY